MAPDGYPADDLPWAHRIAAEVLALPAPAPVGDRERLVAFISEQLDDSVPASFHGVLADRLLARGLRLPAKSASQVELAARLRDMSYRGVQMSQPEAMVYAAYVLSAFDVQECEHCCGTWDATCTWLADYGEVEYLLGKDEGRGE